MLPARAPDTLRPWAPTPPSWLQRLGQFYRPLPAPALPIMHRLAILYLMLPLVLWLLSWFRWWVGWPLALLVSASLGPVLAGSWRGRPRLATWGLLAAALVWVMLSPAGGVFNAANHKDWVMRHALLLDLGRYPWPLFLPDSLAAYVPGDSPPPAFAALLSGLAPGAGIGCAPVGRGRVAMGRAALDGGRNRVHPLPVRAGTTRLGRSCVRGASDLLQRPGHCTRIPRGMALAFLHF